MHPKPRARRSAALLAVALGLGWLAQGCTSAQQESITAEELEQIKAVDLAYASAWLTNDAEQVMATFTSDAVIMPSGMPAFEGPEAMRGFWWPEDAPPTAVTEFALVQHEVGGQDGIGFVRGEFSLAFDYDGNSYTGRGRYLSLMRRDSDGSWRISHRMWSDVPPDVED